MTGRLFDTDSHLREFTATVLSCRETKNGYAVILDRTAFFPESGGQGCDLGTIADAAVLDVQEADGEIVHYTDRAVPPGQAACEIDFARRFRHMQNHSGEHIIAGLIHRLHGFENIGFHLGEEVTADFNGMLSRTQLDEIEFLANKAVFENVPFFCRYPSEDELSALSYRSKEGISGAVRLVKIEGYDLCACCAPHVKFSGEIGLIKITDCYKNKGGIRLVLRCGADALADYREKQENTRQISALLAVKQNETFAGVQTLSETLKNTKYEISQLKKRLIEAKSAAFAPGRAVTALFEEGLDGKELQLFADLLHKKHGGIRAVFSDQDGAFSFAVCGEEAELAPFFAALKARFTVRGGGRGGILQGTISAAEEEILAFFAAY